MNRRKLFSFLALAPVGVVMAKEAKAEGWHAPTKVDVDVPVKVTPGEKCIHCGCPQHIMVPDWSYQVVDPGHSHSPISAFADSRSMP